LTILLKDTEPEESGQTEKERAGSADARERRKMQCTRCPLFDGEDYAPLDGEDQAVKSLGWSRPRLTVVDDEVPEEAVQKKCGDDEPEIESRRLERPLSKLWCWRVQGRIWRRVKVMVMTSSDRCLRLAKVVVVVVAKVVVAKVVVDAMMRMLRRLESEQREVQARLWISAVMHATFAAQLGRLLNRGVMFWSSPKFEAKAPPEAKVPLWGCCEAQEYVA
jgi:hypothetical protein